MSTLDEETRFFMPEMSETELPLCFSQLTLFSEYEYRTTAYDSDGGLF